MAIATEKIHLDLSLFFIALFYFATLGTISAQCTDVISTFPYSQGFETGKGLWLESAADDFDWTRDFGGTPSFNTGPSSGAGGSLYYIYTEASTPNHPSRTAIIETPCFQLSGCFNNPTLSVDYHMYGSDVGTLSIEIYTPATGWTSFASGSGNQGNVWYTFTTSLNAYMDSLIQFRFIGLTGSTGGGWSSDIAIDNFEITVVSSPLPDNDSDGIIDAVDIDSDNDGIPDYIENNITLIDFNTQMQLNGDANSISSSEIQLTPNVNWQVGSAMSTSLVDFSNSFSLKFDVYLGTRNGNGADGVTFLFHNDASGSSAIGSAGGSLGALNIDDGIVLEFDTWQNSGSEPSNDHCTILDSDNFNLLSAPVDFGNLEDGNWHEVLIYWDATCEILSFELDGTPAGSLGGDIENTYFGGATSVYYGFTAATGASRNDQRVRDIRLTAIEGGEVDTDMDGIKNQFDLDSDNDGIWDASEAGHGLVVVAGMITGDIGANGLSDSIETNIDSDTIIYMLSDSEQTSDGIYDPYEIDADDDGCYDTKENSVSDNDGDGIADISPVTVDSNGLVTTITYTPPPNSEWQDHTLLKACLKAVIWVNPFVTTKLKTN